MNVLITRPVSRPYKLFFIWSFILSIMCFSPLLGAEKTNKNGAAALAKSNEGSSLTEDAVAKSSKNKNNLLHEKNLYKKDIENQVAASAQVIQVSGKIVSMEDNTGLPGVNILIRGTTVGTVSDVDGNYSIEVPSRESVLVFTSIGYITEEAVVGNRSAINISMATDIQQLTEVVVVGYGTIKKNDLTGSVGVVEGAKIAERGTVNPLQAVQGQIAGVDISAGSGRAGAGYNIQIRGQNSLQGGEPLYVVDGVIMENIDFINPQDIDRMDILKDASSTAIYGSRGSNGVVLITTKQGSNVKGAATISYDGYYGVRQNVRHPDFMNGDDWFQFRQNTFIMQNLASGNYDETAGGLANAPYITARRVALKEYTDWPSHFLQTGTQQNHWISASGTRDKMNYVIGGGYQEETGNILKDEFKRFNFKASVTHQLSDQWLAGTSFNLSLTQAERGSQSAITNAYRMSPLASPYDSLGNILYQPAKYGDVNYTSSVNPLVDIANSIDNYKRIQGVGNLFLQYSPVEWLSVRSTISPQFSNGRRGRYFGAETEARQLRDPAANLGTREYFSYIWDNQVNINKTIGDHSFNFTGLYSQIYEQRDSTYMAVENLPYESGFYNLGSAGPDNVLEVFSDYRQQTLQSLMGRLNYTFKGKYLITVSNRWDGSSVLGKGHKWNAFPSAAVGWRISEENFFQGVRVVNNLKARFSYGYTGNDNIPPYSTQLLATNQTFYDFGGTSAGGFAPGRLVNPALTWERTREFNLGMDYELLQSRIVGSIDVYDKVSKGLLMSRQLPYEVGFPSMVDNIGSVQNRGIELFLRTENIQTRNFSWSTTFNFAKNNNKILELFGGTVNEAIGTANGRRYAWIVGEDIQSNKTYVWDGIWQVGDEDAATYGREPGQLKIRDISGPEGVPDGKIDSGYDWDVIGAASPDWTGGFSTQFIYKNFDLSASLFTRQGIQVHSYFHQEFTNLGDRGRAKLNVNYYMPENKVSPTRIGNDYPRPMTPGTEYNEVAFYKDASFVKVQNIVLGYNFPASGFLERAKIRSLRLYTNVLNPFVFTKYDGFDPEWANQPLESTGNASVTYQFGVNLKF